MRRSHADSSHMTNMSYFRHQLRSTVIFDNNWNHDTVLISSPHPAVDVLNFPPGSRGKRELPVKTFRPSSKYVACVQPQLGPSAFPVSSFQRLRLLPACSHCRRGGGEEETALRLMLERREAELREAMKLRHSLTTLLHALRVDMEQVSFMVRSSFTNRHHGDPIKRNLKRTKNICADCHKTQGTQVLRFNSCLPIASGQDYR